MTLARLIILFFLFSNSIFAQSDHIQYSIEYCLSRTANTDNIGGNFEPALGTSILARVGLGRKQNLKYTIGLGYLESHIIFRDITGMQSYRDEERYYYIKHFIIPAGIKFILGSFYIHPEIGGSYNYSIKSKSYLVDSEMNRLDGIYSEYKSSNPFEINFTSLLTLGYEFKIGSIVMISGVSGYLALNPDFLNTYGIGLLIGLRI